MSERKVLNKYYPPSFDPSKIPKVKGPKNRTFSIRIMAPFNMRCNTCGVYIYKGKKFNSRKENVDEEDYYGLRIFRFYIKCPCCVSEIAFKTDLKNTDYALEAGATRLFEAEKLAQQMAEKERLAKEAEDLNPMMVLENRTKASRNEIEQLDKLEELRELNMRNSAVDHAHMIKFHSAYEENLQRLQDEEDENMIESIFGKKGNVKRLAESDSEEEIELVDKKPELSQNPTDLLAEKPKETKKVASWQKSIGSLTSQSKKSLAGLVVKKKAKIETVNSSSQSETGHTAGTSQSETGHTAGTSQSETGHTAGTSQSDTVIQSDSKRHVLENKRAVIQSSSTTVDRKFVSQSNCAAVGSGLNMLGNYSDSEENSD